MCLQIIGKKEEEEGNSVRELRIVGKIYSLPHGHLSCHETTDWTAILTNTLLVVNTAIHTNTSIYTNTTIQTKMAIQTNTAIKTDTWITNPM